MMKAWMLAMVVLLGGREARGQYYPQVATKGAVSSNELAMFEGPSGRYVRGSGITTGDVVTRAWVLGQGFATNAVDLGTTGLVHYLTAEASRGEFLGLAGTNALLEGARAWVAANYVLGSGTNAAIDGARVAATNQALAAAQAWVAANYALASGTNALRVAATNEAVVAAQAWASPIFGANATAATNYTDAATNGLAGWAAGRFGSNWWTVTAGGNADFGTHEATNVAAITFSLGARISEGADTLDLFDGLGVQGAVIYGGGVQASQFWSTVAGPTNCITSGGLVDVSALLGGTGGGGEPTNWWRYPADGDVVITNDGVPSKYLWFQSSGGAEMHGVRVVTGSLMYDGEPVLTNADAFATAAQGIAGTNALAISQGVRDGTNGVVQGARSQATNEAALAAAALYGGAVSNVLQGATLGTVSNRIVVLPAASGGGGSASTNRVVATGMTPAGFTMASAYATWIAWTASTEVVDVDGTFANGKWTPNAVGQGVFYIYGPEYQSAGSGAYYQGGLLKNGSIFLPGGGPRAAAVGAMYAPASGSFYNDATTNVYQPAVMMSDGSGNRVVTNAGLISCRFEAAIIP